MIRLDVIISGLVAAVLPECERDPGIILLPRTTRRAASDGQEIPDHHAVVTFRPREIRVAGKPKFSWINERAEWRLNREDVRFRINGGPGRLIIENRDGFVELSEILGSKAVSRFKRGCLGDNPHEECLVNGIPILAGRIFLSNGTLRPVEALEDRYVLDPREEIWSFRSLRDSRVESSFSGQVFGSMLFSVMLNTADDILVQIGNARIKLRPEPPPMPDEYEHDDEEAMDSEPVRTGDLPRAKPKELNLRDEGSHVEDEMPGEQHSTEPAREERIVILIQNLPQDHQHQQFFSYMDRHFEVLYDLLEHSVEPLIPVLHYRKKVGPVNPPGSRCIPAAGSS